MVSKKRTSWLSTGALVAAALTTVVTFTGTAISASAATTYTLAQVKTHHTSAKCWTVVSGKVYNLTSWVGKHPGGPEVITAMCGKDSTAAFKSKHGLNGIEATMMAQYKIATVSKAKAKAKVTAKPKPKPKVTTSPKPVITGVVTAAAVAQHKATADCWTIINNNIYDLTLWIPKHPGGPDVIKALCGVDASAAFVGAHGTMGLPIRTLGTYLIGTVTSTGVPAPKPSDTSTVVDTSTAGVTLSVAEVGKHNSAASCWTIINGNVYNLTNWVTAHPGGPGVITAICGIDGSAAFNGYHKSAVKPADTLSGFFMGAVGSTTANTTPAPAPSITPAPVPVVVPPTPTGPGTNGETLTLTIVAAHATASSCWAVINNNVYDLTNWVNAHPGKSAVILAICGKDGSAAFNGYTHSNQTVANSTLAGFKIGTLGSPATVGTPPPAPKPTGTPTPTPTPTVTPPTPTGPGTNGETLTLTIVAAHATASSCWAVINNNVYDLTNWVNAHPGKSAVILAICGIDGSAAFNGYTHSNQTVANSTLAGFKIGTLGSPATVGTPPPAPSPTPTPTPTPTVTPPTPTGPGTNGETLTLTIVAAHATASSCWAVINNNVYDLTNWVNNHPGGSAQILAICGIDGSAAFNGYGHSDQARANTFLAGFKIGTLGSPATVGTPPPAPVPVATVYTAAQVKAHSTSASCWSAINLSVYDLTGWIAKHPGGQSVIKAACGRNASSVFNRQHAGDTTVAKQMTGFAIGVITSAEQSSLTTAIKP